MKTKAAKRGFWSIFAFYFFVAFEFAYMAGPFAIYFYSLYSPVLNFINKYPALAWLTKFFLPHVSREVSNPGIKSIEMIGITLSVLGFVFFVIGAVQIYYSKLTKKGAVLGGLYKYIRHPQYTSFIVCSFGMLLLWPRYIVAILFVTLVFGYVLLANAEEKECEEKFGESYIEYEKNTGRFFPFVKKSFLNRRDTTSMKVVKTVTAYVVMLSLFLGGAALLNKVSIDSLYSQCSEKGVNVSLCKMEEGTIKDIVSIAKADEGVKKYLDTTKVDAELNYVLPTEWYAAEIPMNGVTYRAGHKSPGDYDKTKYKVIFTNAEVQGNSSKQGTDILYNLKKMDPIVEVWVDLSAQKVIKVAEMPEEVKYDGIPVAVF